MIVARATGLEPGASCVIADAPAVVRIGALHPTYNKNDPRLTKPVETHRK